MAFESGLSRTWYNKGKKAGKSGRIRDYVEAWKSASGKPPMGSIHGTPVMSGRRVTAQESFYQGFHDGSGERGNPASRGAVRLKNFTGTVTRKSNGQVVIRGRRRG